jgi:hypothetical protein
VNSIHSSSVSWSRQQPAPLHTISAMNEDELKSLIARAEGDEVARACRENTCRTLAATFSAVGNLLWVGGYILGPDRASGASPFRFGSDASVGLGVVVQIAGELTAGAVSLLEQGNLYGATALVRQLVEVEYLAWPSPKIKTRQPLGLGLRRKSG